MPQNRVYTNKDLNQPISKIQNSISRTYTNEDLDTDQPPDIMDDQPPDIMDHEFSGPIDTRPESTVKPISSNEPDTWWGGFANSVLSGDALKHGLKSGLGYLKGTFDIPGSIRALGGEIANKYNEKNQSIPTTEQELYDSIKKQHNTSGESFLDVAARRPEEFGHGLGMLTGQPLLTEGLIKATPPVIRTTGRGIESVGRVMQEHTPMSTITGAAVGGHYGGPIGALAGMYKPFTRPLRAMERGAGSVIESIGNRLKNVGNKSSVIKNGEIVNDYVEGEFSDVTGEPVKKYKVIRKELPPSKTGVYGPESDPNASYHEFYKGYDNQSPVIQENQSVVPIAPRRKIKSNGDGTFTDKSTGEVLDNKGNPVISVNGKELDRNSEFFTKNRQETGNEISHARTMEINPETGRPNIYAGGADPRVLDVLGTSLYTKDMPNTVAKELLQNSLDEMKITNNPEPVNVAINSGSNHPITGKSAPSIMISDRGRGLTPEQLYTIFTDVGKTGKGNEISASGGFGFAKAAPLLGGEYAVVESIVNEGGKKIKYTFEGSPKDFNNEARRGVPLKSQEMPQDTPTGLRVQTYFKENAPLYNLKENIQNIVENSPQVKGVRLFENYSRLPEQLKAFESGKLDDIYVKKYLHDLKGKPNPPKMDTLQTVDGGANIDVHYALDNKERTQGKIVILNNGLYVTTKPLRYGETPLPHLPEKVVFDVKSLVEEGNEGYPFGLNREALSEHVNTAINEWLDENVIKKANNTLTNEMQNLYNGLKPINGNRHVVYDVGAKYNLDELKRVINSPHLRNVANAFEKLLEDLHNNYYPGELSLGDYEKFGFQISDEGSGGINIPNPSKPSRNPYSPIIKEGKSLGEKLREASEKGFKDKVEVPEPTNYRHPKFAIMFNPFSAMIHSSNPLNAAQRMVHIIMHEFNHNFVRSEGGSYTWNLAKVIGEFPFEKTVEARDAIHKAITTKSGEYAPELQKLLQEYQESRGRAATKDDVLGRQRDSEWIKSPGQEGVSRSSEPNGKRTSKTQIGAARIPGINNISSKK